MEKESKELTLKMIGEIQKNISEALEQWSTILIQADADGWSYHLHYSDEDLMNAMLIYNHVWMNRAIHNDYYKDDDDVNRKMTIYRNAIKEAFDIDTWELSEKVLGKEKNDEPTTKENSTEA